MSEGLRCSTCGAEVGERAICPRCGTLIAAERRLAKIGSSAHGYVTGTLGAIPRRLTINHYLWACALMPVFVLPPLASLSFAIFSLRQRGTGAAPINGEWLAIVSLLNIVLCLLLLYKLHFSPYEIAAFVRDSFYWLLRTIFHVVPGGGQPSPRVIPI
jgi:uncharacterized C2H2 Zn-finger protein